MESLKRAVGAALGTEVLEAAAVHGGDVAAAHRMELADGRRVFAKTHASPPAGFFTTEAAGLRWLREPGVLAVPEVLAVSDGDDATPAHLVLEWIEVGPPGPSTETELGRSLAELHGAGARCFGRGDRRTTGSRGLPNEPCETWAQFYATQRMAPLALLAQEAGATPDPRRLRGCPRSGRAPP